VSDFAYLDYNGVVEISSRSPSPSTGTDASVTQLLHAMQRGDSAALQALFPLVYDELRGIAHRQRRAWQGDLTLDTTALVHEAYLKLVDQKRISADSRAHFLGVAAKAMRHILCNYSKSKQRLKRGGGAEQVTFDDDADIAGQMHLTADDAELLEALDEALRKLEAIDKRQSEIVECRFFGGMSIEDTAVALAISPATVKRHWTLARAWLYREMKVRIPAPVA
jgi:RNA polymerase sigma factor (TIGR02999 family)